MYLISTAKTTVLSDLNGLETKSVYHHANGETTDFQFYTQQRIFLEVNKKSGLEIMRIKQKAVNDLEIQRVRKLNIEKVYCVACAKQSLEEMAFGGVNGQVSLYNYKTSSFLHRFKAENNRNSVLYLDYNGTDEYISSVFENGQINVYGTKTKMKIDTINVDSNSTLARFHPTKRFHLSIASFKGAVSVYDLQARRKTFNYRDAHAAPCRDLCMSPANPDTLISVGYDCVVNIFDTRRKSQVQQLQHDHPLSTGAVSCCGTYLCVGNLKGELLSYDMRKMKTHLAIKKVHAEPVARLAFVPPTEVAGNATSFMNSARLSVDGAGEVAEGTSDPRKSLAATRPQRDSFCDFLDFQANKLDRLSARFVRRDSFDLETLIRRPNHEDNCTSLSKLSSGSENLSENTTNSSSNSYDTSFEFVNTRARGKQVEEKRKHSLAVPPPAPLRDRSNTPKVSGNLMLIEEEEQNPQTCEQLNISCSSDKENLGKNSETSEHLQLPQAMCNSTPTPERSPTPVLIEKPQEPISKLVSSNDSNAVTSDVIKKIEDLRLEINARFQQLEAGIKFNAEENKWQMFTQAANIWAKQMNTTEDIRDALGVLLQTDPFVIEFMRLKEENDLLRAQVQQLLQK